MTDVSELMKLDSESLTKVQSVISLLHLLGLSDEDIALLPEVLKNWRKMVDTVNAHSIDLANVKRSVSSNKPDKSGVNLNSAEAMQRMVGFGESAERVDFSSDKGGKP